MTRLHQNFAKILMISFRGMNCSLFLGRTKQIILYDMVKHELRVTSYQFRFESLKHKLDFKSASCEFKSTSLSRSTAQKMKFSKKDFFSKCDQIRRKLRVSVQFLVITSCCTFSLIHDYGFIKKQCE